MFLLTVVVTLIVWNLPSSFFGIDGLTVVQQRVIAIFVMAVMLWLTEAIPAWATSVSIIFVLLFFVSDSSFKFMQGSKVSTGDYSTLSVSWPASPTLPSSSSWADLSLP